MEKYKKMDFLCTTCFPGEEDIKFEYTSDFQKKVIVETQSSEPAHYISGTIRIGDQPNPSSRNKTGMFSNSLHPIGYNYTLF